MRILIVEDDTSTWRFLKDALMAEFFAVDVAEDGAQGLSLALSNEYDVVILDTTLPVKDGMHVCREIRSSGRVMPILVISDNDSTCVKVGYLDAGADDYLSKPIAVEELLARVRALLRRPSSLEPDILSVEDVELDQHCGVVRRAKKELYLTRKEYLLLQYLMRNHGVVLSRSMIIENVWDMSVDVFSNTIESHILSLRKKLGDTGSERLIRTIPGRGYRMSA